MAGRPDRKKRREREAAAASRRPVKPEEKRLALQLEQEHGAAEASRRCGIPSSTIRMWKSRNNAKSKPRAASTSRGAASEPDGAPPGSRAERLRARAERSRDSQWKSEDRADRQIGKGQSAEARNSMVAANSFSERAAELEESARLEELHEIALSEARGRLVLDLVGSVFDDVALPRPDALLRARLEAWPRDPDPEIVEQARGEVRRPIAGEVRAEILAELAAERRALPALPAGETEGDDESQDEVIDAEVVDGPTDPEDDLPSWDSLPREWRQRYSMPGQRRLARYEYREACKREEIARRQPRAPGRFDPARFSHPSLSGGL